ncbi:MAG TPA: clostripain-related cysteine peptidase [Candidatus Acidoferrum sp.]|nr:clostripain-related cysteine peptidase [Candidatus Acidoferrum sp.]
MNNGNVKNNWTIMVYISADDVLANFAIDSLNQLRQAASDDGDLVMALFDPNDGSEETFRFRFDGTNKEKPLIEVIENTMGSLDMADPKTLTDFVMWASGPLSQPKDRHYCLILWGHGTELLLDRDPGKKGERYLTPAKLKTALENTGFNKDNKLDFVAFDACSMSMVEVASALQGCAQYMIASQDEVPDVSFPYARIVEGLRGRGGDPKNVVDLIPEIYVESFRDYLVTRRNGVKEIMLSSLNLENVKKITDPVSNLARLLLHSVEDKDLADAIVQSRHDAHDFVLGLFVDLYDFCEKLPGSLDNNKCENKIYCGQLKDACKQVRDAIKDGENVIANVTRPNVKDCHGVSIYFPYSLEKNEDQQIKRLLGKAGTGILNLALVKGGGNNPRKARNGRIEELEADFKQLPFFNDEGWGAFIKQGWSLVLARKFPKNLDLHYSAEQVAMNLSAALGSGDEVKGWRKDQATLEAA